MRRLLLLAGLCVLAVVWGGPLLAAWRGSFSAHMVAHMGVVAVAAPLHRGRLVPGGRVP